MTRYIDADALKNSIDEHVYLVHHGFNETEYGCTQCGIHQIIDEAPTIDAVPVRHGKWVPKYIRICGQDWVSGMKCSECGEDALNAEGNEFLTDYCPNCGARMDGTQKKPCDDCQQFDCYGCEYSERKEGCLAEKTKLI